MCVLVCSLFWGVKQITRKQINWPWQNFASIFDHDLKPIDFWYTSVKIWWRLFFTILKCVWYNIWESSIQHHVKIYCLPKIYFFYITSRIECPIYSKYFRHIWGWSTYNCIDFVDHWFSHLVRVTTRIIGKRLPALYH